MRLLVVVILKHGYNDNKVQDRLDCPRGTGGSRPRAENEFGKENYIWASGHLGILGPDEITVEKLKLFLLLLQKHNVCLKDFMSG